jgi:hypothetical protein
MARALVIALLFTALSALGSGAAAARTPRAQTMPAVAFNSHPEIQSYLAVWVEDRGNGPDLYAKRLSANGLPQGGPARDGWAVVRSTSGGFGGSGKPSGPRSDPSLVYNGTQEEFLVVFSEFVGEPDGWDVFAVRVSAAGFSVGAPRRVAGGPGDQQHPDAAVVEDGEYLVVWDDNARDLDEVWAVRLRANSIPKSAPYALVRNDGGPTTMLRNASDPTTNGAAVAWVDDRDGQTDIWSMRLKNGLKNGPEQQLSNDTRDDSAPRYGEGGLVWNRLDGATGLDIVGAEVYENDRTRGAHVGILVPAADQAWPDAANGLVIFADNRTGEYDLFGIRLLTGVRVRGREFAILSDYEP